MVISTALRKITSAVKRIDTSLDPVFARSVLLVRSFWARSSWARSSICGAFNVLTAADILYRFVVLWCIVSRNKTAWGDAHEARQPRRRRHSCVHAARIHAACIGTSFLLHVRCSADRHAGRHGEGIRMGQSALLASRHCQ